jgi:hypothetical protein
MPESAVNGRPLGYVGSGALWLSLSETAGASSDEVRAWVGADAEEA